MTDLSKANNKYFVTEWNEKCPQIQ